MGKWESGSWKSSLLFRWEGAVLFFLDGRISSIFRRICWYIKRSYTCVARFVCQFSNNFGDLLFNTKVTSHLFRPDGLFYLCFLERMFYFLAFFFAADYTQSPPRANSDDVATMIQRFPEARTEEGQDKGSKIRRNGRTVAGQFE